MCFQIHCVIKGPGPDYNKPRVLWPHVHGVLTGTGGPSQHLWSRHACRLLAAVSNTGTSCKEFIHHKYEIWYNHKDAHTDVNIRQPWSSVFSLNLFQCQYIRRSLSTYTALNYFRKHKNIVMFWGVWFSYETYIKSWSCMIFLHEL